MMTTICIKENVSSFYVICSPRDLQAQQNTLEYVKLLESVKPDSLLLIKENISLFFPSVESNDASLLYSIFSKARKIGNTNFIDRCILVNFNDSVTFCCHSKYNPCIDLMANKYIPKRIRYFLRYEEIFAIHKSVSLHDELVTKQGKVSDQSDLVFSIKRPRKDKILKPTDFEDFHGSTNKKRQSATDLEVFIHMKAYFEAVPIIRYQKRRKRPTALGKDLRWDSEAPDQEGDSISLLYPTDGEHYKPDTRSTKIKRRQRKRRKTDFIYRKSCPEMSLHKFVVKLDTDERSVFSDSENPEKPENKGKEISLKLYEKDGNLKTEVRKHLKQITNLPLSRYPWRIPDIFVYPGRRKKNERPIERRPQRSQARDSTLHAQPTEDDPTPEMLHSLPSDRYALPSQPESRNLQHLLSSFTPRVEPISASTQQLRRLSSRPRHQQYAEEAARRESFTEWPSNTGQNPENMVTNGFFYTGRVDLIRCYMCGIGLKDWSSDDEPLFEHVRHSPDCPFLFTFLGQDVLDAYKAALLPGRAQPAGARDDSQSIEGATNRPEGVAIASDTTAAPVRNPDYAELRQRIESFSAWPRDVTQTPRQLAEAGFFHTGDGDTVRCYQCDGGLRRWDPRDDPWIEHTRWFPHCPYVRQIKGIEYVELVQRAIRESAGEEDEPLGDTVGAIANLTVHSTSSEPQEPAVTTQTILEMGYTRESLTEAMKKADDKGMVNYTPKDLLEILMEMGNVGELTPPEPTSQVTHESRGATREASEDDPLFVTIENKSLRKVLKCSECKIRDKNILFLPCTHHCLCEECAEAATKCPVCDVVIDRKIKTYMS